MTTRRLIPGLIFTAILTASLAAAQTTTDQPAQTGDQPTVVVSPALTARLANVPFIIPPVPTGLSAAEYLAKSKEFAAQAAVVYPVAFVDKPLWTEAIKYAEAAYTADSSSNDTVAYLGGVYTTTQWWFKGYEYYKILESRMALTPEQRTNAALDAAKVGYIRLTRGLNADAAMFLQASLNYVDSPDVRAMLAQAQK